MRTSEIRLTFRLSGGRQNCVQHVFRDTKMRLSEITPRGRFRKQARKTRAKRCAANDFDRKT